MSKMQKTIPRRPSTSRICQNWRGRGRKAKSEQAPTQKESFESQQKAIAEANPLDQI